LVSYNSLDNIEPLKKNFTQETSDQYWYLNNHEYHVYAWKPTIFDEDEINSIIKIGKSLNIERALTGGTNEETTLDYRRSFVSWIPMNDANSWIYQRLTKEINEINSSFFKFDLTKIEKLQFTHYDANEQGFYDKHVDPMGWNLPHNRKLSVVIQLSDPSEYEGGELIFYNSRNGSVVEKRKGMTVFFPSYTLHECTPVTKGNRYALVAWVHGPTFK
jgi:PKHD-type hydroxylase